jgi:hypothetical protein
MHLYSNLEWQGNIPISAADIPVIATTRNYLTNRSAKTVALATHTSHFIDEKMK